MNINEVDVQKRIYFIVSQGAKFTGSIKLESNTDNLTFMIHGLIFHNEVLCHA